MGCPWLNYKVEYKVYTFMIMHQSYILYQYIHMHAVFYMFNNPLSASGVVQLLDNTD